MCVPTTCVCVCVYSYTYIHVCVCVHIHVVRIYTYMCLRMHIHALPRRELIINTHGILLKRLDCNPDRILALHQNAVMLPFCCHNCLPSLSAHGSRAMERQLQDNRQLSNSSRAETYISKDLSSLSRSAGYYALNLINGSSLYTTRRTIYLPRWPAGRPRLQTLYNYYY